MEVSDMQELDCVEVVVEKEKYVRDGVHKGMQGWICYPYSTDGYWLVNFPQYGEKDDVAEIDIKEEDMKVIPKMDAKRNEQIKEQFENAEKKFGNISNGLLKDCDDISDCMV